MLQFHKWRQFSELISKIGSVPSAQKIRSGNSHLPDISVLTSIYLTINKSDITFKSLIYIHIVSIRSVVRLLETESLNVMLSMGCHSISVNVSEMSSLFIANVIWFRTVKMIFKISYEINGWLFSYYDSVQGPQKQFEDLESLGVDTRVLVCKYQDFCDFVDYQSVFRHQLCA